MVRPLSRLAVFSVLLLTAGPAFASGTQGGNALIIVTVTDDRQRAVSNACVTLVPEHGGVLFGKSNGSGKLRWTRLAPGKYRVVVKVEEFVAQKKEIVLSEGENEVIFSLEMKKR